MSIDALQWAFKRSTGKASTKLVLISLAERANEDFECWPSIRRLEKDTELNSKTITRCLNELEEAGIIADTGRRKGKTSRVKIYQLVGCMGREGNSPKNGTIKNTPKAERTQEKTHPKMGSLNDPKNGGIKHTQKRVHSEGEIDPKTEQLNTPKIGCQNHTCLEPKGGGNKQTSVDTTGTGLPATETPPGFDDDFKIPDWLDPELWALWENYRLNRINAPWDDLEKFTSLGELSKAHREGHDARQVIRNAILKHWKHPYAPKNTLGSDIPLQEVVDLYNQICAKAGMLPCNMITSARAELIASRVRNAGMTLSDWETFFRHAAQKPELCGKAPPGEGYVKPFRASIDYLLGDRGFTRIDEEITQELCE